MNEIKHGDSLEVLEQLENNSVHAVITDPPYGLAFMGRDWDDFEPKEYQGWCQEWAEKAKQVLKPGGHLLAFSGNRTHHRLFTGVEDAGFEIRDTLTWHYGGGFPKNSNSQLKPATEFIVLSRNGMEGTAKSCHEKYGTAYLNIDGARIETSGRPNREVRGDEHGDTPAYDLGGANAEGTTTEGRYPANVVFDETAAEQLDEQVGETSDSTGAAGYGFTGDEIYGEYGESEAEGYDDSGGPSRYFYTSKASKSERTENGSIDNSHPTVKPIDLMEWLIKLVTKEEQIVLDPFAGSGTTCKAAKGLNRQFIGIEKQAKWADIARVRCGLTPDDPTVVRDDDGQEGLEAYSD